MGKIAEASSRLLGDIERCCERLGRTEPVQVVAASKYADLDQIREARRGGIRIFAENRFQDGVEKIKHFADEDMEWHFIGRIQSNKVCKIFDAFSLVQSVDRLDILDKANAHLEQEGIERDVLLQVNISAEPQKGGFMFEDVKDFFEKRMYEHYSHIRIRGLMGVGPVNTDRAKLAKLYRAFCDFWANIRERYPQAEVMSLGMSDDYEIALEAGSNMVRVGSKIFK